jgi:hypothetical protein
MPDIGHGARGGMDWLRSRAYLGFLNGYGLDDLLARLLAQPTSDQDDDAGNASTNGHDQAAGAADRNAAATGNGSAEGTDPDDAPDGPADRSCAAGDPGRPQDEFSEEDAPGCWEDGRSGVGGREPGSASAQSPGAATGEPPGAGERPDVSGNAGPVGSAGSSVPAAPPAPADDSELLTEGSDTLAGSASGSPAGGSDPKAGTVPRAGSVPIPPGLASPPVPPGLAALTGSVNLVMPALAWLGLTDAPGEITGTPAGGPADATTCRDLAAALAGRADARWCLTLTGPDGRAIAHGCARRGPGPPGSASPAVPHRPGQPDPARPARRSCWAGCSRSG